MDRLAKRILLGLGALALFLLPIAALGGSVFDDVDDSNIFAADIEWMKDNKITIGCNPPLNTNYCPEDNVTRQQMAAFMHRLSVNKVVFAATAETAKESDTVDGKHADELGTVTGSISADLFAFDTAVKNPTNVVTLTGFDAPAAGGVITVNASVNASIPPGGPSQLGLAWIEIDNGGTCGQVGLIPGGAGWYMVDKDVTIADSTSALVTEEVAAGTHRIDLCTVGIAPATLTTLDVHMNVSWSPSTSVAGVASADLRTYQEMLAPYQGMFDK